MISIDSLLINSPIKRTVRQFLFPQGYRFHNVTEFDQNRQKIVIDNTPNWYPNSRFNGLSTIIFEARTLLGFDREIQKYYISDGFSVIDLENEITTPKGMRKLNYSLKRGLSGFVGKYSFPILIYNKEEDKLLLEEIYGAPPHLVSIKFDDLDPGSGTGFA